MNLEAVPCVFKSRQEDGNEAAMFGLLIRPSAASSSSSSSAAQGQSKTQQQFSSAGSRTPALGAPIASALSTALSGGGGPSSIQIVPAANGDAKKCELTTKVAGTRQISTGSGQQQMVQLHKRASGSIALLASTPAGMPPILPRPKQHKQQQQKATVVQHPPKLLSQGMAAVAGKAVPCSFAGALENVQSPSQVVPQFGTSSIVAGQQSVDSLDVLSVATSSSASSSSFSPSASSLVDSENCHQIPQSATGLLAIQSSKKTDQGDDHRRQKTEKAQKRRKGKQQQKSVEKGQQLTHQQQKQMEKKSAEGQQQQQQPTTAQGHHHPHDPMLGEDLHSIDLSQLVNSAVITTEDYLPSQQTDPMPIYTGSMDIYTQQPLCQPSTSSQQANLAPGRLCPRATAAANFLHSQQQQQQIPAPCLSSQQQQMAPSCPSSTRYLVAAAGCTSSMGHQTAAGNGGGGPQQPQTQQQSTGWHPYLMAHPGGSHISSTPDSGIQSIDGSPPSVYTPPMVSPYASQVRSCESVGTNYTSTLTSNGHHPPPIAGHAPPPASAAVNGAMFNCSSFPSVAPMAICGNNGDPLLLMSGGSSAMCHHQQQAPPRLIGQRSTMALVAEGIIMAGSVEDGFGDELHDFSDMPKLVPVTHLDHDEDDLQMEADEERGEFPPPPSASADFIVVAEQQRQTAAAAAEVKGRRPSRPATATTNQSTTARKQHAALMTGVTEVMFHEGMSLQELAECISTTIPPEKLKQLTSLIQTKVSARRLEDSFAYKSSSQCSQTAATAAVTDGHDPLPGTSTLSLSSPAAAATEEKDQKRRPRTNGIIKREKPGIRAKCEKLAAKGSGQQKQPLSSFSESTGTASSSKRNKCNNNISEGDRKSTTQLAANEEAQRQQRDKLREYRRRVREQLDRKLEMLLDLVSGQMVETHLGIENDGHWRNGAAQLWRRRLDWEEVRRRVDKGKTVEVSPAAPIGERIRGRRKKKDGGDEDQVQQQRKGRRPKPVAAKAERMKEEEEKKKDSKKERKRSRKQSEGTLSRERGTKKRGRREGSSSKDQQQQTHPSVVIRLPKIGTNERKRAKGAGKGQQKSYSRTSSISIFIPHCSTKQTTKPRQPLSMEELTLVRSKHSFLVRNLRRNCCIGGNSVAGSSAAVEQCANEGGRNSLTGILRSLFAQFRAICLRQKRFPARRHLRQLSRTVRTLLISHHFLLSATVLDRFDSLLKQFLCADCVPAPMRDSLHASYLQLKRAADFSQLRPSSLVKDSFVSFLQEDNSSSSSRRRAMLSLQPFPSSPSSSSSTVVVGGTGGSGRRDSFHRPLTVDTGLDLSYMDSPNPIRGDHWDLPAAAALEDNKSAMNPGSSDNRDHNCVRCICGIAEDDGTMTQCDRCYYWLHSDCLDLPVEEDQELVCDFCSRQLLEQSPRVDIVLRQQLKYKLSGCTYYRTLVNNRGLQVRINEAIYVERLINDKHKSILRELDQECVIGQSPTKETSATAAPGGGRGRGRRNTVGASRECAAEKKKDYSRSSARSRPNGWWPLDSEERKKTTSSAADGQLQQRSQSRGSSRGDFHRRDLRIFRVERLFVGPNGQRFIFGNYYARPHETFCDSSRMFYRNELFWTPLFDTLPLDSVVARCLILEPQDWARGRPKYPRYQEDDVYVCEYQIDRNQRSFEKIQPKNRYYINTQPYMFNQFPERWMMKRDFTPFRVSGAKNNSSSNSGECHQQQQPQDQQQHSSTSGGAFVRAEFGKEILEEICTRLARRRKEQ